MTEAVLHDRIGHFYDATSGLWEGVWGEHMHHGHYGADGSLKKDHRQAQVDMVDELLRWGRVEAAEAVFDSGCGIGGSTLYLSERLGARRAEGVTLSPVQAARATERAQAEGLSEIARFQVADAQEPPFPREAFDLVWSLESGEHMPDKAKWLGACARVLAPGGTLLMATWCHRSTPPPLTGSEQRALDGLYRDYHLPYVLSLKDYADLACEAGLERVETADWTEAVAPFWGAVLRSALTSQGLVGLARGGGTAIKAALAMRHMIGGYRRGLVRFGVLKAHKPEAA